MNSIFMFGYDVYSIRGKRIEYNDSISPNLGSKMKKIKIIIYEIHIISAQSG